MMKRYVKQQILVWSMVLGISAAIFSGCSKRSTVVSFGEETNLLELSQTSEQLDAEEDAEIVVYICGAVENPGVFVLPAGSRINDVLEAAGGFSINAAVASVNLAAKLQDEEMICVLTVEEMAAQEQEGTEHTFLVDINTADIDMLCKLPGIGESKARDIIMYREEKGAFRIKEDIMKVDGIKENLYKKISDLITVKVP